MTYGFKGIAWGLAHPGWGTDTGVDFVNSSPVVITPTLGVELLTNPDLSAWTGDNPDGWTVAVEAGGNPEITERDSGQLHADTKTVGGAANYYATAGGLYLRIQQQVHTLYHWYQWQVAISAYVAGAFRVTDDGSGFWKGFTIGTVGTQTVRGRVGGVYFQARNETSTANVTIDSLSIKELTGIMVAEKTNVPIYSWGYNHWHIATDRNAGGYLKYNDTNYIYWYADRVRGRLYLLKCNLGVISIVAGEVVFTYSDNKAIWFRHPTENRWQIGYDTPANIESYGDSDWATKALIDVSTVTNINLNLVGSVYEFGALSSDATNVPVKHRYHSLLGNSHIIPLPDPNDFLASNAAGFANIVTSDGSGQAVHPSVVKFDMPWNGYTHWMAMTPFPFSNAALENPEILASNDGDVWIVPNGLTNPIAPYPGGGSWNADTELVYNPADDNLYCFYIETDGTTYLTVKVMSSLDGVTWSSPTDIVTGNHGNNLSPTVIYDGTQWVMYTIGGAQRRYTAPTPDGPWTRTTDWSKTAVSELSAWHIHVHLDDNGAYFMLLAEANDDIYLAVCDDGQSFVVATTPLLANGTGGWDNQSLYRACSVKIPGGLDVWYTGKSNDTSWHIGRTQAVLN